MEDLQWLFNKLPFEPNSDQKAAMNCIINSNGHINLVGLAGTGKSVLMELLHEYYKEEAIFVASTGVANLSLPNQIGCGTGHSVLSLPTKPATELTYRRVSDKTRTILGKTDMVKVIVIDEAYSYNSDVLDVIWRRLQRFNKPSANRDARNIRVILVGDPIQQVTIADDELKDELMDRWGSYLMFRSTVWPRFDFSTLVLQKVERQDDKVFKACLEVIRYAQRSRYANCLKWLNQHVEYNYDRNKLVLAATNKTVERINNEFLLANPNPKYKFTSRLKGKFDMKDVLVKETFTGCLGLRVMTVNNDKLGRWVNGSCGEIVEIDNESVTVCFDNGETHKVDAYMWENKHVEMRVVKDEETGEDKEEPFEVRDGCLIAIPVVQANSFSISKSQGLTLSSPYVIDMESDWLYTSPKLGDFGTNFAYIALSRATDVSLISLARPMKAAHLKPSYESIEFWNECCKENVLDEWKTEELCSEAPVSEGRGDEGQEERLQQAGE